MEELQVETQSKKVYNFNFTGSGGEFFRIWIVNLLLSIVTFGIYIPWAKVRQRKYFYSNTVLDNSQFSYLGDPVAILKGYLVIFAFLLIQSFFSNYNRIENGYGGYDFVSLIIMVLFILVLPFLLYKSLRFKAHSSSYRNIRFRFAGTLKDSYFCYLLLPITIPLSLGITYPLWAFYSKKYYFDNMAYGSEKNTFSGKASFFYVTYAIAFGIFLLFFIAAACLVAMYISIFQDVFVEKFFMYKYQNNFVLGFFILLGIYIYILLWIFVSNIYLYISLNNYCFAQSKFGSVLIESQMKLLPFFWITLSNSIGIVITLGFYTPWARVRRMRYILENIQIVTEGPALESFCQKEEVELNATGDAASDYFDFEIGL